MTNAVDHAPTSAAEAMGREFQYCTVCDRKQNAVCNLSHTTKHKTQKHKHTYHSCVISPVNYDCLFNFLPSTCA